MSTVEDSKQGRERVKIALFFVPGTYPSLAPKTFAFQGKLDSFEPSLGSLEIERFITQRQAAG